MALSLVWSVRLPVSWGTLIVLYVTPLSNRVAGTSLLFFPECKHRSCKAQVQVEGQLTWGERRSHNAKGTQDGGDCCGCLWKQSPADTGLNNLRVVIQLS